MNYNKKQMQPLIDKYAINPETNKLFNSILEMFDEQPNYQIWAVKVIFSNVIDIDVLETIHAWIKENQGMVKMLSKQNIVSYSTKQQINTLLAEMEGLNKISLVKNSINHFNTDQRKMLNEYIFPKEYTPLEANANRTINKWAEIFKKFNRLPYERKNKFYSNCSRFRNVTDLLNAIETCLEETYKWDKEDFLAFLSNNASDCEIVFNEGPCVIVHVPSFSSSKLLCGNGRTSWCITQQDHYFRQYVTDHSNRDQYFLFDFSRKESDAFAHIGFTMQNGRDFYCAQTCNNSDMKHGYQQGKETMNINQALEKLGVKMSVFLRLNPLINYKWNFDSIVKFIRDHTSDYAIAFEKDGRLIVNVLNRGGFKELCEHTLIADINYNIDYNNKVYVFIDTNLKVNDEKSIISMLYQKDQYGTMTLKMKNDAYNTEMLKSSYLSEIGILEENYINREAIDPHILLHKYIDEDNEIEAIKLIEKEGKDFNVNYEFLERIPITSALNHQMYKLFGTIINHPKFDSSVEDGFGETLLESLLYLYASEEISTSETEVESLKKMILYALSSDNYDFNVKDLNSDTAITIACEYPKMLWVVKALASKKNVDINIPNDFDCAALGCCIRSKNLEALKVIGQRPDVKVRDIDKELAKKFDIDLKEYIKPNKDIFGSFKFEGEYAILDEIKKPSTFDVEELAIATR